MELEEKKPENLIDETIDISKQVKEEPLEEEYSKEIIPKLEEFIEPLTSSMINPKLPNITHTALRIPTLRKSSLTKQRLAQFGLNLSGKQNTLHETIPQLKRNSEDSKTGPIRKIFRKHIDTDYHKRRYCYSRCSVCLQKECSQQMEYVTLSQERIVIMVGFVFRGMCSLEQAQKYHAQKGFMHVCRDHFVEAVTEIYKVLQITNQDEISSFSMDLVEILMPTVDCLSAPWQLTPFGFCSIFKRLVEKNAFLRDTVREKLQQIIDIKSCKLSWMTIEKQNLEKCLFEKEIAKEIIHGSAEAHEKPVDEYYAEKIIPKLEEVFDPYMPSTSHLPTQNAYLNNIQSVRMFSNDSNSSSQSFEPINYQEQKFVTELPVEPQNATPIVHRIPTLNKNSVSKQRLARFGLNESIKRNTPIEDINPNVFTSRRYRIRYYCFVCSQAENCHIDMKYVIMREDRLIIMLGCVLNGDCDLKRAQLFMSERRQWKNGFVCYAHFFDAFNEICHHLNITIPGDISSGSLKLIQNLMPTVHSLSISPLLEPYQFRLALKKFGMRYNISSFRILFRERKPEKVRKENVIQETPMNTKEEPIDDDYSELNVPKLEEVIEPCQSTSLNMSIQTMYPSHWVSDRALNMHNHCYSTSQKQEVISSKHHVPKQEEIVDQCQSSDGIVKNEIKEEIEDHLEEVKEELFAQFFEQTVPKHEQV